MVPPMARMAPTNASAAVREEINASLAVSLAASVFDGGVARAEVQARQAAAEQARAALASALLGALRDVENALVALAADRERLQRLDAAVAAAAALLLGRPADLAALSTRLRGLYRNSLGAAQRIFECMENSV